MVTTVVTQRSNMETKSVDYLHDGHLHHQKANGDVEEHKTRSLCQQS